MNITNQILFCVDLKSNDKFLISRTPLLSRHLFLPVLFVLSGFIFANVGFAQCRADSVITYSNINGKNEITSIEYFSYDLKDSLVSARLVTFQQEKATPVYENKLYYSKVKGNHVVVFEISKWASDRAAFVPAARTTRTYSKKGVLLSELNENPVALKGEGVVEALFEAESKTQYNYSSTGDLVSKVFFRWNKTLKIWVNESKISYEYNQEFMTKSTTLEWDSLENKWISTWRNEFSYNDDNSLAETITYQFDNLAWIPETRTSYGIDTVQRIKGNIVQKWNGSKRGWDNKFYYVFKLNEKGLTDTEVHLSWSGKEWLVDLTFFYSYNESGQLIQVMDKNKEIIVDRFCN